MSRTILKRMPQRPATRILGAATAAALTLGVLAGCAPAADDRPLVVVTTNILGDVVGEVLGDEAEVMVLMRPDADPHSFEISAREAAQILDADLLVTNGLGLEEGLASQIAAAEAEGVTVLSAGDVIEVLDYAPSEADAPDADADAGATPGTPDPHFWTDPAQMVTMVAALEASAIRSIEGINADTIRANADRYTAELTALDGEMAASFGSIPAERRNLVTNHHVFGYLADRYDFTVVGAVIPGGSTLAAPSASDLRELVEAITVAGVPTIFAESSQPDRLIQVLADEAGIEVAVVELFTESLSESSPGADTYLTMMRTNMQRITTGLSP